MNHCIKYFLQLFLLRAILTVVSIFSVAHRLFAINIVTLDYPPLQFVTSNGDLGGPIPKLVCTVLSTMNESCKTTLLPWPRALRSVKNGQASAVYTAFKTAERESYLVYTVEPLVKQEIYIYGTASSDLMIDHDFSRLSKLRIGVTSTISYGEVFDRLITANKLNIDRADDLESAAAKLMAGRIDAFVSNSYSARVILDQPRYKGKIKIISSKLQDLPSYLAFSRKDPRANELAAQFSEALQIMKKNGQYQKIMDELQHPSR